MSSQSHSKIKSAVLIASVAILAMVFGIVLDDNVIPEKSKPLTIEEDIPKQENHAHQASKIKELDSKTKATIEEADRLTKRADQLISKSDISEPKATKQSQPADKKSTERLAGLRDRLDALRK